MTFIKYSVLIKTGCLVFVALAITITFAFTSYRQINTTTKATDTLREEIPVFIEYDNQHVTPYISVTIGGKTYKAVFDTGSSGLRILSGAVEGQVSDTVGQRVRYSYGDDKHALFLRGKVVTATMQFGRLKSAAPIRLMSIDSAQYGPDAPWTLTGDSALIKSSHFRGLPAIIGIGLRLTATGRGVASPFAQLPGNGIFIIKFPGFGKKIGKILLNPEPKDMEGFTFFHLLPGRVNLPGGYSSWMDNQLDGCLSIADGSACLPTMLDCGAPDIEVFSKQFTTSQSVPRGTRVVLQLKDRSNPTVSISNIVNVSDNRAHGLDYIYLKPTKNNGKNLFGIRFFFDYDILYDAKNGLIGLRKK